MNLERLKQRVKQLDKEIPDRFHGVLILDKGQKIPEELIDYPNLIVLIDDVAEKLADIQ